MTQDEVQQAVMEVVDHLRRKGALNITVAIVADGCVAAGGNEKHSELAERLHECAVDWIFTDPEATEATEADATREEMGGDRGW